MTKKASTETSKALYWVVFVLPLLLLTSYMLLVAGNAYEDSKASTPQGTEDLIIETRVLYSPACIAYVDTTGRVRTGTIQPDRLRDVILDECIQTPRSQQPPVQVVLRTSDNVIRASTTSWEEQPTTNPHRTQYAVALPDGDTALITFRYKQ